MNVNQIINDWPEESKEAAELVINKYGQPDEASESYLTWHNPGPWKRMVAYKDFDRHEFPAPHIDAVESFLEYGVPTDKFSDLAKFDGSVVANRTKGEISARCHDEEANFLALNLAKDIIDDEKTVEEARDYYAREFLASRQGGPTPYMEGLRFEPEGGPDLDERMLSNAQLEEAQAVGTK
ncbi:hypothetical protein KY385_04455 [Candidatus Parcubacteria bacterium]|nr:hypothetical protein [Candidatus Parcubacteria bacterium]